MKLEIRRLGLSEQTTVTIQLTFNKSTAVKNLEKNKFSINFQTFILKNFQWGRLDDIQNSLGSSRSFSKLQWGRLDDIQKLTGSSGCRKKLLKFSTRC